MTTAAHSQSTTIRLLIAYPAHEPREGDPHYAAFTAFEARCRKAGLDKCAVCGSRPAQCHHSQIEFSLINAVDVQKFDELYGLHLDEAGFQDFVEGPGNAEWLCLMHHIGSQGVHVLPEPFWVALRVQKVGTPIVTALDAGGKPLRVVP